MPSFPKSFLSIEDELERIRSFYKSDFEKPCLIVGNGPSSVSPSLSQEDIARHFRIRMNWFFVEKKKIYGTGVDAFFWSVDNKGLREALELNDKLGEYDIRAFFQPHISTDDRSVRARNTEEWSAEEFDQWAVIATCPELARFMMSRPLPTQGVKAIAFAAILGFKTIRLTGIDMYGSPLKRYAWDIPPAAQEYLEEKDLCPGYEPHHDMDRDLRFLEITRSIYDFELLPASKMDILEQCGVFDRSFSISTRRSSRSVAMLPSYKNERRCAYVTHADGRYSLGAMALARSLQKNSNYKLIVMYSEPDAPHYLSHLPNVELRYVDKIQNPNKHGQVRFASAYSKLWVFDIAGYDRLTFIDSDAVVLQNVDDIFQRKGFWAAPDLGLDPVKAKGQFNSGVFSFDTKAVDFRDVLSATPSYESSDGGDQGFLNMYFDGQVNYLPVAYNTLKRALVFHPELIALSDVKVLHYVGAIKPWDILGRFQNEYLHMNVKWVEQLTPEDWQRFYFASVRFAKRRVKPEQFESLQKEYAMEVAETKKRYDQIFVSSKATFGKFLDNARECIGKGQFSLGIYLYTRAFLKNRSSTKVLIELADAYRAIGDEVSERHVLEQAFQLRPDRKEIIERLGMAAEEFKPKKL